jgi:histidinol phosphatase-like enzyme
MEAIQQATFTSLRGGRYRCNQTGDHTKDPKKYAFIFYKKKRNEQLQKEKVEIPAINASYKKPKAKKSKNKYDTSAFGRGPYF